MIHVLPVLVAFSLVTMNVPCGAQAIEAGSNIGSTEIDTIIRKEGYGGIPITGSSPLSRALRTYLVEQAKRGGATAVEVALSEAGASCHAPIEHARRCELRRFRILRSIDIFFPKHGRTDWIISISYDRRGSAARNILVTDTQSSEIIK